MSVESFPNNDISITLSSGGVIRFYEQIVFWNKDRAESCSIHYDTTIPASDHSARINEAKEVIQYFSRSPGWPHVTRANASICSTPAQAATREAPEQIYMFELGSDSSWTFVDLAEPRRAPPNTR